MRELLRAINASDGSSGAIKRILAPTTNIGVGEAFWMGDGDDLLGALLDKDWKTHRYAAPYYWVVTRDGQFVSYTEGDIHYSDNPSCGG